MCSLLVSHYKEFEFEDWSDRLRFASRLAAARELFAETGLDVRGALDRLIPANTIQQRQAGESRDDANPFDNQAHQCLFFLFLSENDCLEGVASLSKKLNSKTTDACDKQAQVGVCVPCNVICDKSLTFKLCTPEFLFVSSTKRNIISSSILCSRRNQGQP